MGTRTKLEFRASESLVPCPPFPLFLTSSKLISGNEILSRIIRLITTGSHNVLVNAAVKRRDSIQRPAGFYARPAGVIALSGRNFPISFLSNSRGAASRRAEHGRQQTTRGYPPINVPSGPRSIRDKWGLESRGRPIVCLLVNYESNSHRR